MPETPIDHWEYTIREWSGNPFNQILDAIPDVKVVYDIGANVGGFTEVMHRKFPGAEFYCFEPIESNYDALLNYVPYATCMRYGIWYGATESRATWRGSNIGAFFLEQVDSGEPRVFSGEILTLKELEQLNIKKPDLIKMDVEGAEENIIANSIIVKECPNLIIEWHPDHVDYKKFFEEHLPNHKIVVNLENKQFLLCL